jgi:uncharacterized protein YrrD
MLRMLKDVFGNDVVSAANRDEDIGKVDDMYFDCGWTARYVIVDSGGWFNTHRVLVAPEAFAGAAWSGDKAVASLTREQIERAPNIDADKPVSRQQEIDLRNFYGWTPYWGAGLTRTGAVYPAAGQMQLTRRELEAENREHDLAGRPYEEPHGDPHLRSAREVSGYRIHASDGEIGHVDGFMVDFDGWQFRYVVVDTGTWLPGKRVLLSTEWVRKIDYPTHEVFTDVARDRIKGAPKFDPSKPFDRAYESRLHDYYGRPAYWQHRDVA